MSSVWKCRMIKVLSSVGKEIIAIWYLRLRRFLETKNLYGFADIEKLLFELLNNEEIKKSVNQNISYLVIDEYQDTSSIQFQIVKKIINGDLRKLYVVGDPKQSIYSFRGGEIDVFFKTASLLKINVS